MGEFVLVFVLTLVILLVLVCFLSFGRAPTYRPSREEIRDILAGVLNRTTSVEAWDMFLGMPIIHDAELEQLRRRCISIHEGLDGEPAASGGMDGYLYDRAGRERIKQVLDELERIIRESPVTREF
ncbi:hypothetical protein [Marinobacterium mangrovicola]|uniref:Uncharacterized protein n=1 Tax=Marinobacterium mangrovicola TaxID=1476959 RepID=A0A4R1GG49_9GAMM|nr:hypothetical protein [Marinobacterium mangrovicola]TCK05891.1 hypothetical protein CLV83_2832 [Marinobacterium mangrovicola]